jgi:hypothetical protein
MREKSATNRLNLLNANYLNPLCEICLQMSTTKSLVVFIAEKSGVLKLLSIKHFQPEDLFKKCGFKIADGFVPQVEWTVNWEGTTHYLQLFAKSSGRKGNSENKYKFPPPIHKKFFFGNCAIVAHVNENGQHKYVDLSLPIWNKLVEQLLSGEENLNEIANQYNEKKDESVHVLKNKKTNQNIQEIYDEELGDNLSAKEVGSELSEEEYCYDNAVDA